MQLYIRPPLNNRIHVWLVRACCCRNVSREMNKTKISQDNDGVKITVVSKAVSQSRCFLTFSCAKFRPDKEISSLMRSFHLLALRKRKYFPRGSGNRLDRSSHPILAFMLCTSFFLFRVVFLFFLLTVVYGVQFLSPDVSPPYTRSVTWCP